MVDIRSADQKPKGSGNPNRINRLLVKSAAASYKALSGMVMLQNLNLNSEQTLELRQAVRAKNCRLHIVRSRVTKRALSELGLKDAGQLFQGPTCVLDADDPVSAAKAAMELLAKYNKALKLTGGVLEGKVLPAKDVETLARSKSRLELLGDVVGLAKSPGARVAGALKGPGGRIAGAIKALVEKLEKAETKA
jgi:large subunit ribosomal protein L10